MMYPDMWWGSKADRDAEHVDVVSVALMEWQIKDDYEKAVLDFYFSEAAPTIAASPDVLRFRLLKVDNATVLKAQSYDTLEKQKLHTYLSLVELESEEWPWDVVIALGENPKWKEYFEDQKAVVSVLVRWGSRRTLISLEVAEHSLPGQKKLSGFRRGRR